MLKTMNDNKKKENLMMKKDLLKGLSKEQIERVNACRSQEELLALAREQGIELTDEQLDAINGGACGSNKLSCPKCGYNYYAQNAPNRYACLKCGACFYEENGQTYLV